MGGSWPLLFVLFACSGVESPLPQAAWVDGQLVWGLTDASGVWILQPTYGFITPFSNGVAVAKVDDNHRVLLTEDLEAIPLDGWSWVGGFREGRAAAKKDGRWGMIDGTGRQVLAPSFDRVDIGEDGTARVLKEGRWGFVDRDGAWIAEPVYEDAEPFEGGYARVRADGRARWLSRSGDLVPLPKGP